MKKRYLIVPLLTLLLTSNVYAITSNDVTYDNDGTTENLTTTLDNLYSELNKYKTGGSVQSSQMLEGATGYSKGELVTGTIKSKAATTYTPGTSNQTITAGQYLSGAQTIKGDANLVAANIAKGKSIFGVSGTYTSDATATAANILSGKTAYVNGSKVTGTMTNNASKTVNASTKNMSGNYTQINIPASGYYDTNSKIQIPNSTLVNSSFGWVRGDVVKFSSGNEIKTINYTGLTVGGYYSLVASGVIDVVGMGIETWGSSNNGISAISGGTVQTNYGFTQQLMPIKDCPETGCYDVGLGIYDIQFYSIFRADSSNVSVKLRFGNDTTNLNMQFNLYRIF